MIGTTGREVRNPLLSRRAPLLALLVVVALVATGCGGLEARVRTEGRAELSAWAGDDNSSTDPATVTAEPTLSPVPTAEPSPTRTPTPNPTSTPPPAAKSVSPASAELRTDPVEGALAPELSLPDLNDNEVRLSALRGKPVLLNFWTTW